MNLDDLRAELGAHANNLDTHATGRMAGIRAKIAQRRRRKAGATVAASVLAVGAIIGVPVVNQLSAGPEPAKGGHFPEKIDGDIKIAEAMGDKGDTTVTLEFTPEDTDFLLKIDCDDLAPKNNSTKALKAAPNVQVSVNDAGVNPACGVFHEIGVTMGLTGDVATRTQVREFWERGGVTAGEEVTLTLRVNRGLSERPREEPIDGQIGVAVYDMTGARSTSNGAAFPKTKTLGDETYELGGYDADPDGSMSATIEVPRGAEPALVTYGTRSRLGGVRKVTVDGRQGILTGKGGIFTEPLPDARAHTVRIKDNEAGSDDVVIAYYTRVDDSEDESETFPVTIDGDRLIDSVALDRSGWTDMAIAPHNLEFLWALKCNAQVVIEVEIPGYMGWTQRCRPDSLGEGRSMRDQVGNSFSPDYLATRRSRSELSLDDDVTIRARVKEVEKKPSTGDEVEAGLAAYDMSGPRKLIGDVGLPLTKDVDGQQFVLADYETEPTTNEERSFSLDIPSAGSGLLVHGTPALGRVQYRLDAPGDLGLHRATGSGFRMDLLKAHTASTITMTMKPHAKYDGSPGVLAYYRPLDDDSDTAGLSFPATNDARDPLVASDVGEPGESVLRATFTPDDANLALTGACTASSGRDDIAVSLSVNGHGRIISGGCGSLDGEIHFNDRAGANRQTWRKYGVDPGEPVDVVVRARPVKGTRASLDDVQLGFAAYERSAPRTKVNGFSIDECHRRNGEWYKLDEYETVDVTDATREASLRVRETGDHVLVGYGYSGGRGGLVRAAVDGRTIMYGKSGTNGFGYERISGDAHEIGIKAGRKVSGGKLVIAYYVPEE